jgi:hypothetical protein
MAESEVRLQCAWCGRLIGQGGIAGGPPLPDIRQVSHGICRDCLGDELAALGEGIGGDSASQEADAPSRLTSSQRLGGPPW